MNKKDNIDVKQEFPLDSFLRHEYKRLVKKKGASASRFVADPEAYFRAEFYFAIERVVPEAFSSLADEVFPIYQRTYNKQSYQPYKLKDITNTNKAESKHFLKILRQWGGKWNLDSDWALDLACAMLSTWQGKPSWKGIIYRLPMGMIHRIPKQTPLELTPWNPWAETEKMFDQRLSHEIKAYKNHIKGLYKEIGWKEMPKRRARSGHISQHLEWLALYQVGKWSQVKIAEKAGVTRENVSRAIKNTAKELGITLRKPGKAGRPRQE